MPEPKPGWFARQARRVAIETACWSPEMRREAGISTQDLTPGERAEAVRNLRLWADELEREGRKDAE